MSRFHEWEWYLFGLRIGLMNLMRNGLALGLKKTVGKIAQPINTYTRFPEYDIFLRAIYEHTASLPGRERLRILDIGSPKLFGLAMTLKLESFVCLTDISRSNLDEYVVLWNALQPSAKGRAVFEQMDGRLLPHEDGKFDIVYSMSVLEHVEGERNDSLVMREILRVLKPAGLLLVSVPFGDKYEEQGFDERVVTHKSVEHDRGQFFQRIYDRTMVTENLLSPLAEAAVEVVIRTVYRENKSLALLYHRFRELIGTNALGLLGFTNPCFSRLINRQHVGFGLDHLARYDSKHRLSDIYSDLLIAAKKRS